MTAPNEIANFFSGGSASAKFPTIGSTVRGRIKNTFPPEQQTDIKTRAPVPGKYQIRIELATDERDPEINNDDGTRMLYVRGWMTGAIGAALRQAGATEPKPGGQLTVTYINGSGELNDPKQYAAVYTPPATTTAGFFNGGGQVAAPSQPVDVAPPGFDPAVWAGMPEAAKVAIRQALPGARVVANDEPPF